MCLGGLISMYFTNKMVHGIRALHPEDWWMFCFCYPFFQKEDRSWGSHLCRIDNLCSVIYLWFNYHDEIWVLKLWVLTKNGLQASPLWNTDVCFHEPGLQGNITNLCLSLKMFKNPDNVKRSRPRHLHFADLLDWDPRKQNYSELFRWSFTKACIKPPKKHKE